MENTPRLHDILVQVMSQHRQWLDVRHLKTLACMMTGPGSFDPPTGEAHFWHQVRITAERHGPVHLAVALTRPGFVLALTTHYLVAQGTEVVKQGRRRWVDPHWFRGNSYLRSAGIGSGVPSARAGNC